jgi:hypothetical protein
MTDDVLTIQEMESITPEAIQCVLEFCYTGLCSNLTFNNAISVLKAAIFFATEHLLIQLCEQTLVRGIFSVCVFSVFSMCVFSVCLVCVCV